MTAPHCDRTTKRLRRAKLRADRSYRRRHLAIRVRAEFQALAGEAGWR